MTESPLGLEMQSEIDQFFRPFLLPGCSDIHFDPRVDDYQIRMRKWGLLHDVMRLSHQEYQRIVMSIKVRAGLEVARSHQPLDGSFLLQHQQLWMIRVALVPSWAGEKMSLRLLPFEQTPTSLHELGCPSELTEYLHTLLSQSKGLIIVAGSTGSGKTTTLYACLQETVLQHKHIITLEDPIEVLIPQATQCLIQGCFAKSIRHVLRLDPDVILIGELRDSESANAALQASLTGHLVLSTLHADNCLSALVRLFYLSPDWYALALSLRLIIVQQLLPLPCLACHQQGCAKCFFGRRGRRVICEWLTISSDMRQAWQRDPNIATWLQLAESGLSPDLSTWRTQVQLEESIPISWLQ